MSVQKDDSRDSHGAKPLTFDVPLASRTTRAVDHRLRMLALIQRQPLSHVLTQVLDQALPPADELLEQLRDSGTEAVAV